MGCYNRFRWKGVNEDCTRPEGQRPHKCAIAILIIQIARHRTGAHFVSEDRRGCTFMGLILFCKIGGNE